MQRYVGNVLLGLLLIFAACSSAPRYTGRVQGFTPPVSVSETGSETERALSPLTEVAQQPMQIYVDGHWQTYWAPSPIDSYEAEWQRYSQQETAPPQTEAPTSPAPSLSSPYTMTYYSSTGPWYDPYHSLYVEYYYPHSNFAFGIGVLGYEHHDYHGFEDFHDYYGFHGFYDFHHPYQHLYGHHGFHHYPYHLYGFHGFHHYFPHEFIHPDRERGFARPHLDERQMEPLLSASVESEPPRNDDENPLQQKEPREKDFWSHNRTPVSAGGFTSLGFSDSRLISDSMSFERIDPFRSRSLRGGLSERTPPSSIPRLSERRASVFQEDNSHELYKGLEYSRQRPPSFLSDSMNFRAERWRFGAESRTHTRRFETSPRRGRIEASPRRSFSSTPRRSSSPTSNRR